MTYKLLDSLGITYIPTQSSALLINFGSYAGSVAEFCKKHGIKCRGQEKCGVPGHIQVHLIDPETVTPFLEMLRDNFALERRDND